MKKITLAFISALLILPTATSAAGIKTLNGLDTADQLFSTNPNSHLQVSSTGSTHTFSWDGSAWAVNQGGTGATAFAPGAILFGSSTGPIATDPKFTFDSATGKLYVGTTPTAPGIGASSFFTFVTETAVNITGISPASLSFTNYNTGIGSIQGSGITVRSARGTQAAPQALQAGDLVGKVLFNGFDGTGFQVISNTRISARASESWTPGTRGTDLDLLATNSGTSSASTKLHLGADTSVNFPGKLQITPQGDIIVSNNSLPRRISLGNATTSATATFSISAANNTSTGHGGDLNLSGGRGADGSAGRVVLNNVTTGFAPNSGTTTVQFGRIGDLTSTVCFTTKTTNGRDMHVVWVDDGSATPQMVVEYGACLF